jgi:hypothetical protein
VGGCTFFKKYWGQIVWGFVICRLYCFDGIIHIIQLFKSKWIKSMELNMIAGIWSDVVVTLLVKVDLKYSTRHVAFSESLWISLEFTLFFVLRKDPTYWWRFLTVFSFLRSRFAKNFLILKSICWVQLIILRRTSSWWAFFHNLFLYSMRFCICVG